ncbi:NADPH-dependent F420 reductase [Actinoplanes couchii]|uniref:Oxidoreductase n=1 Tax=Actinoplanes couchii TaxID=403638 RepID=A0ABQ3XH51_9ACTN|nr:hypothetical protein [Actinoplanes couchii]MDR6320702.1 putative dinucleotide-binding enzyme [Actinoplanes couchii]GID57812.1 oxidoreductase [Actinoplanes couchii]
MTRFALLGAGAVARTIATGLASAGRPVVVGSRRNLAEAAAYGDVVVNALPGDVSVAVLAGLRDELRGKVVVDVANAVRVDERGFAAELLYPDSSLAENVQRVLPDSQVVKALSTMHASLMARTGGEGVSVFLSGDSAAAKDRARELLTGLGWESRHVADLGPLVTARWAEGFVLAVRPVVEVLGPVPFGWGVVRSG